MTIHTKHGLLYRGDIVLGTTEADDLARANGFHDAEELVEAIQAKPGLVLTEPAPPVVALPPQPETLDFFNRSALLDLLMRCQMGQCTSLYAMTLIEEAVGRELDIVESQDSRKLAADLKRAEKDRDAWMNRYLERGEKMREAAPLISRYGRACYDYAMARDGTVEEVAVAYQKQDKLRVQLETVLGT